MFGQQHRTVELTVAQPSITKGAQTEDDVTLFLASGIPPNFTSRRTTEGLDDGGAEAAGCPVYHITMLLA